MLLMTYIFVEKNKSIHANLGEKNALASVIALDIHDKVVFLSTKKLLMIFLIS